MRKRQSYSIAGKTFPTKGALQEHIRKMLYHYGENEHLSPDDHFFMLEVLKHHPDYESKIGTGAKAIYVKQNPVYKNTRGFWILRNDDSETDFSYLECLKETSHAKRFVNACRVAIEADMQAFKQQFFDNLRGESYYCPYTSEPLNFIGSHVDHKSPNTFQKLVDGFIAENAIDVNSVIIKGKGEDNVYQDTFADKDMERLWIDYHQKHADLQIVSKKANLGMLKVKAFQRVLSKVSDVEPEEYDKL